MNLQKQLMEQLRRMNLSPVEDGDKIHFSYDGVKYLYCDKGMEGYLNFMTFIADVRDCELFDVYQAINEVNARTLFTRCFLSEEKDVVLAVYEFLMCGEAKLEYVILNAFSALSNARSSFLAEMNNRA